MTTIDSIALGKRARILVVALRRLGDVLLTTPLIRSLRRAFPEARIDALVFSDTTGVLVGNPDIDRVIAMPARPTVAQSTALAMRLFKKYDLAISTQSGDRPTGFAILAGRQRIAPVENKLNGRIKRVLLHRSIATIRGVHRVEEMLRLADALGVPRVAEVVPPHESVIKDLPTNNYAVIHASPMFHYKRWTKNGWRKLAAGLSSRGLTVIATGGPAEAERRYLDEIWSGTKVERFDGRLDWQQLSGLLAKARVYIGPDTSVTHLAAATGCPTVALYGPTDPRLWGPWPVGGLSQPWMVTGTVQHCGNVWLVQHAFPCTPCQLEGCERKLESHSACLDELPFAQVTEAVSQALKFRSYGGFKE